MKRSASAVFCVFLLVGMALAPAKSLHADELYGWSISASNTDPFVNTAPPETGFYSLYAWLFCITSEPFGHGVFRIDGSLADRIVGFSGIPPFIVGMTPDLDLFPYIPNGGCLWSGAYPGIEIFILDPSGTGGALCIVDPIGSSGNVSCVCGTVYCLPNAVIGFASDGTDPCMVGQCTPSVSVESQKWGSIKALYR